MPNRWLFGIAQGENLRFGKMLYGENEASAAGPIVPALQRAHERGLNGSASMAARKLHAIHGLLTKYTNALRMPAAARS